jgi:hypothetical protein
VNVKNVYAQLILFVAVIGGYVALAMAHVDTLGYVGLVTPVIGAVFVVSRLDQRSDAQDRALSVITSQTNGVLTKRIREAVGDALSQLAVTNDGAAPVALPAPDTPEAPAAP